LECGMILLPLMFAPSGSCTIVDSSSVAEAHAEIDYAAGQGLCSVSARRADPLGATIQCMRVRSSC
jgi:hypothetical protein